MNSYGMRHAWAHSPTVGGASAEGFAGEALAGIGDTQERRAQRPPAAAGRAGGLDFFNFLDGTFAGEDDQGAAEFAGEFDAARRLLMVICVEAWIGKSGESRG